MNPVGSGKPSSLTKKLPQPDNFASATQRHPTKRLKHLTGATPNDSHVIIIIIIIMKTVVLFKSGRKPRLERIFLVLVLWVWVAFFVPVVDGKEEKEKDDTKNDNKNKDATNSPSVVPSRMPSLLPSYQPSQLPSRLPTTGPSELPSRSPSRSPTATTPSPEPPTASPVSIDTSSFETGPTISPSTRPTSPVVVLELPAVEFWFVLPNSATTQRSDYTQLRQVVLSFVDDQLSSLTFATGNFNWTSSTEVFVPSREVYLTVGGTWTGPAPPTATTPTETVVKSTLDNPQSMDLLMQELNEAGFATEQVSLSVNGTTVLEFDSLNRSSQDNDNDDDDPAYLVVVVALCVILCTVPWILIFMAATRRRMRHTKTSTTTTREAAEEPESEILHDDRAPQIL